MVAGKRCTRKTCASRRVVGPCLRLRGDVTSLHRRRDFSQVAGGPADGAGRTGYGMRRAGPAAPTDKMSMTVIALVLVANLLLAGLFSLVALAVD